MNYTAITQTETALLKLIEATKRKKAANTLVAPVDALDAKISALFIRQGNALVRALAPLRKLLRESAITDQFDSIFDSATEETSVQMLEALEKAYKTSLLLGATQQLAELKIKLSFSLDNPRAVHYIAKYGAETITSIDDTTRTDLRNLVKAAVENGDSYDALAKAIKSKYKQFATGQPQQHIRSRAHLIAVTEIGNGYQAGNHASMQAVQDTGIKMQKYWLTSGDERVSDGCTENAGAGWIGINAAFPSGDMHPLRFPGCRCVAQYQRAK